MNYKKINKNTHFCVGIIALIIVIVTFLMDPMNVMSPIVSFLLLVGLSTSILLILFGIGKLKITKTSTAAVIILLAQSLLLVISVIFTFVRFTDANNQVIFLILSYIIFGAITILSLILLIISMIITKVRKK